MSSSILEVIRMHHEQSERYEISFGQELDEKPSGQKAKVWQQHKLNGITNKIIEHNNALARLYDDEDGMLQEEVEKISGENNLNNFYSSLQMTLDYYERFPSIEAVPQPPLELQFNVDFSGEEIFGKYLDLNPLYIKFSNIIKKANIEQDYLQYLERFYNFFYLSEDIRKSRQYLDYLGDLWEYLYDFYKRVNPVNDIDNAIMTWQKDFLEKVSKGEVVLLGNMSSSGTETKREPQSLRLGMFNDVKELEALGMERLKEGLEALGLKCGGTLQDRAQRLWSVRGKKLEDIPNNLKSKPTKGKAQSTNTDASLSQPVEGSNVVDSNVCSSPAQKLGWFEFRVTTISEVMADIVSATRRHTEKQQALTVEEKRAEIMEEEFGLLPNIEEKANDDDDDDGPIYNPLNLPLGWDGKPIPYWLYKLHGLGVEYKCEICGNQSYWGRRAFDRHFQEFKHAYGMKCLGVPNTKHFHDITSIEDVLSLYNKIKNELKKDQYVADYEEEFEDTHGNVLNRRTYEDLARQGLL